MAQNIAFMGYSDHLTGVYLDQLVRDNAEQVARYDPRRGLVTMKDGTRIIRIYSWRCREDGRRFDQVILADDRRMEILQHRRDDLAWLLHCCQTSASPEELRLQIYDIDEEAPT